MELNTRREIACLRIPIYPRFIVNNHFGGERNEKKLILTPLSVVDVQASTWPEP